MAQLKKQYYTWTNIEDMCRDIILQMYADNWRPDYIVGLTRGGNIPSTIISNWTGIRCEALKISLRDDDADQGPETNCWMSEDAFNGMNILVIDDINDTGETLNWLQQDWEASCYADDLKWQDVWGGNVRFATLTENLSSSFGDVKYYSDTVNKAEEDVWLVYPWERIK